MDLCGAGICGEGEGVRGVVPEGYGWEGGVSGGGFCLLVMGFWRRGRVGLTDFHFWEGEGRLFEGYFEGF